MVTINYKFKASTEHHVLPLVDTHHRHHGIKVKELRSILATKLNLVEEEIILHLANSSSSVDGRQQAQRLRLEEVVMPHSTVEVEKNSAAAGEGHIRRRGVAHMVAGPAAANRDVRYIITKECEMLHVGGVHGNYLTKVSGSNGGRTSSGPHSMGSNSNRSGPQTASVGDAEDDESMRIRAIQGQVADQTGLSSDVRLDRRGQHSASAQAAIDKLLQGPPPDNFTCYSCGAKGHWLQHCPLGRRRGGAVSAPIGVPEASLVPCSADDPARHVTRDGRFVKRKVSSSRFAAVGLDRSEYYNINDINHNLSHGTETGQEGNGSVSTSGGDCKGTSNLPNSISNIPQQYICSICTKVMKQAVELPCCHKKCCNDCVMSYIETSGGADCFSCEEMIDLDEVRELTDLREEIQQWWSGGPGGNSHTGDGPSVGEKRARSPME
eukprot:Tbor_TRINITY_DN6046_c0_g1::TRINITY_DN6046_c0_g1_i1::g.10333::m.10333